MLVDYLLAAVVDLVVTPLFVAVIVGSVPPRARWLTSFPLFRPFRGHRAAATVTSAAAAAAAEAAESRSRSVLSTNEEAADQLRKTMEEQVESVRRQAREDVARAKEEADMSAEEERSRALKEVRGFRRIAAFCVCVCEGCMQRV